METLSLSVLPLLILLALLVASSRDGERKKLKAGDRVSLIGDSLAVGLSPALRAELAKVGAQLRPHGRGATHAGQWLSRGWLEEALADRPALVVVSLGTNDANSLALRDAFGRRIAEIVRRIQATGARALLLEPPPMPFDTSVINTGIRASGGEVFSSLDVERQSDRIHPTTKGNEQWAAAIKTALG